MATGTPVRRLSRGRISWRSTKPTTLVRSHVTPTTSNAESTARSVIVSSPAVTLALVMNRPRRSRSSSAECASMKATMPAAQQNSTTTRRSAPSTAVPRSRTLRRLCSSGVASNPASARLSAHAAAPNTSANPGAEIASADSARARPR